MRLFPLLIAVMCLFMGNIRADAVEVLAPPEAAKQEGKDMTVMTVTVEFVVKSCYLMIPDGKEF